MQTEIQELGTRPAVRDEVPQLRRCLAAQTQVWVWEKKGCHKKEISGWEESLTGNKVKFTSQFA